ncbi:MAG: hypothetical protein HY238_09965, partial [Acidobacteria bacterium]|nr:hypothetical protein [Acidobacteriota bacterium]
MGELSLRTEIRNGVERADVRHASTGDPVTDENPAAPGEILLAMAAGMTGDVAVLVGEEAVPAARLDEEQVQFTLPSTSCGSFVEISVVSAENRSNAATVPVAQADPSQLSASDVDGLITRAALAVDDPRVAIAVVDRAGRPLAIYRKPQAT